MARWPGKIPAGKTTSHPITSVDLFPTCLELAGSPPPNQPLDGVSLVKTLQSGGEIAPNREALYWHFPGYLGAGGDTWRTTPVSTIRAGDWKLLEFFEDNRLELYNLKTDLSEKTNLAERESAKREELHAKLKDWRAAINAPIPQRTK
jgi:arylsulfatase A-like enzyme